MMADQEEEDLRMALRMSMQNESPEPKRSKPGENAVEGGGTAGSSSEESPEAKTRRMQRQLMAAAAERRLMASKGVAAEQATEKNVAAPTEVGGPGVTSAEGLGDSKGKAVDLARELSPDEANQLFLMVFGSEVTRGVLAQWSNQGIRFSPDPETSMGLVQHEGGPCGVLAAIQAFVLKYLLFSSEGLGRSTAQNMGNMRSPKSLDELFASLTEDRKSRALVRSMGDILFSCGSNKQAVVATLSVFDHNNEGSEGDLNDEVTAKALEGLSFESGSDVQKVLRVDTYTSKDSAFQRLEAMIPVFRSRMGAMLFLISALLSRGLDLVQEDRDDPSQSLVTAPFGHASQEIVNLLLCGEAVAHVFDGNMDLGGGMSLKGISNNVDVGFLTLLESLNFCKVGQHLKCPKWPIWVVGSESHYTVLFALDTSVQDENEFEGREALIRRAFDAQDQSGGGGFISVEGFHHVLRDTTVILPQEKLDHLSSTGYIVWSEFWQVILDLDKSFGGLKDSSGLMGKKVFDLYHFNGIAKSDLNGGGQTGQTGSGGETPVQRPRLTKLRVSVPPRWTPEEFMSTVNLPSESSSKDSIGEVNKPEPPQHAPLVDCIRTRWPRATCNWAGDPPSIV